MTKKSDEIRFIRESLTPSNPKDAFYVNKEEMTRKYFLVALVGMMFLLYIIFY